MIDLQFTNDKLYVSRNDKKPGLIKFFDWKYQFEYQMS